MFLFILAAIVSGDVVRFNTVNTQKSIQLMMGGAPQTFEKDIYGRLTWMDNPSTSEITLIIGDESFDLRTSRTGAGYNGCNYNFDLYSDSEMYQNSGMECTKVFEKAPGAIELINDVGKSVYPAFDLGWGFSSDSVMGWLGADMIAVYTSENPYLAAIGAKEGTELEVGYFDQSDYKSCGKVKVGEEFIKKLSECTGIEEAVGANCKLATGWDKKHNCGGGYWELKPWGCCSQMCCPAEADTQEAVGGHPVNPYYMKTEVGMSKDDMKKECWDNCMSTLPGGTPMRLVADICNRKCPLAEESVGFDFPKNSGVVFYGDTSGADGSPGRTFESWGAQAIAEYNAMSDSDQDWVDRNCGEGILEKPRSRIGVHTFTACRSKALKSTGTFVYFDGDCYLYKQHQPSQHVKYLHHRPKGREHWMYCSTADYGSEAETEVGGIAGGLSHPHDTMTGKYTDYFKDGGKCNGDGQYTWTGKWSYQNCDLACLKSHCATLGRVTSYGDYTLRQGKIFACCTAPGSGAESSMVAEASTLKSFSTEDWAVYGFAVIGIGALAMQAYKMVKAKNSEAMPIYQEV